MRLYEQMLAILSEDNDQKDQSIDKNLKLDDTLVTTSQQGTRIVAVSTEDVIAFDDVTLAKYLIVIAYDEVQIRINDAAAPLMELKPIAAATTSLISVTQRVEQPAQVFIGPTSIDFFSITNSSATDTARVFYALIGEPV